MTPDEYQQVVAGRMREDALQQQVQGRLRAYGWWAWHDVATNAARKCPGCGRPQRRRNKRGLPDLIVARAGVVKGLELKSQRGRVSPEQAEALAAFAHNGHVIRPLDLLDGTVDDILR